MNNPRKRNALSLSMLESLRENILTDVDNEDLRVIVISGVCSSKAMGECKCGALTPCVCCCQRRALCSPQDMT